MQFDFQQIKTNLFLCRGSSASNDRNAIFTNCKMLRDFDLIKKDSEWTYICINKNTIEFYSDYINVTRSVEYNLSFEERNS